MRIAVAGGCGFIGSRFVESLLRGSDDTVINLDKLTYAVHPETPAYLEKIAPKRYEFHRVDIAGDHIASVLSQAQPDLIVNFAAESHVDRSILDPGAFVQTNIVGTQRLLDGARKLEARYVQVSTDEVYGTLSPDAAGSTELSHLDPNSPYAASKAAADLLVLACGRTYEQEVVITRCTNNFGPGQFPEKLLPLVIANALEGKSIPIYGDGRQIRDWIYVDDHCEAIAEVARKGKPGQIYNISARMELDNLTLVKKVLDYLGKPHSLMEHVKDRPAHDRRYSLDCSKIESELRWKPSKSFTERLHETIDWYVSHQDWWKQVRDDSYFSYYEANYKDKFAEQAGESQ